MAEQVSAGDILDADSEDMAKATTDTDATVSGSGETTWDKVPAGWAAAIMAMEEAFLEPTA